MTLLQVSLIYSLDQAVIMTVGYCRQAGRGGGGGGGGGRGGEGAMIVVRKCCGFQNQQ